MLRIGFVQLRHRPVHYLWLWLGLFLAVTATVATAAITASLTNSAHQTVARGYAGTDVVVTLAPTDRDAAQAALTAIGETPGVADVAFDQVGTASIAETGSRHRTIAVNAITAGPQQWRTVDQGRLPTSPAEVVTVGSDVAVGSEHLLRPGQRGNPVNVTVVGKVSPSAVEELDRAPVWLAHPQAMLEWFPDRVGGEIRVAATPAAVPAELAVALEASLVPVEGVAADSVAADTHITTLVDSALTDHLAWFIALGAFLAAIAGGATLLLYTAWLRLLRQREPQLKLLREIGATAGQQRVGMVLGAVLVGTAAWLPAVPGGLFLAGVLAGELGSEIPLETIRLAPAAHLIIAVAALAASTATALAAYRSTEHRLTSPAHHPALLPQLLWLLAGLVLLTIGGIGIGQQPTAIPSDGVMLAGITAVALVTGIALVAGLLIPAIWRVLAAGLSGRLPAWLHLAVAGVLRYHRRIGALVAVVVAGTALSSLVLHAEQPVRELLTWETSQLAGESTDAVITGAGESLAPQLVGALQDLPGVSDVTVPPAVMVTTPGERTDTAFAVPGGDLAALESAGPRELIVGVGSPLRTELVNGSVTTLHVFGQQFEVVVIFGDGPRTLIDAAVAEDAQAAVAAQRGIPVELAPDLPAPVALLNFDDAIRLEATDSPLHQLRELLADHGQQVSLQVLAPLTPKTGPPGWLVAVIPALLILLMTYAIAGNLVSLTAPGRSRWSVVARELGLTTREQLAVVTGGLGPTVALAAVIGVFTGAVVAEQILPRLLPTTEVTGPDLPAWAWLAFVAGTVAVILSVAVAHQFGGDRRRGAVTASTAAPARP